MRSRNMIIILRALVFLLTIQHRAVNNGAQLVVQCFSSSTTSTRKFRVAEKATTFGTKMSRRLQHRQGRSDLLCPLKSSSAGGGGTATKDGEEPLSAMFQRAVVLQRAGNHEDALVIYERFVKAAKQCDVSPVLYAEVHVNMGAAHLKQKNAALAKFHFEQALKYRSVDTAHVNLALLALQEGSRISDPNKGIAALTNAKWHCEQALQLKKKGKDNSSNPQTQTTAMHLLEDIQRMFARMNN